MPMIEQGGFTLSQGDMDNLVRGADGFSDKAEARQYLEARIDELQAIKPDDCLYRVLIVGGVGDIDTSDLGCYWTLDEDVIDDVFVDYLQTQCFGEALPGEAFILRARFPLECIDPIRTLMQNVINPHEKEILLKPGSQPLSEVAVRHCDDSCYEPLGPDREVSEEECELSM